jgi:hypothetical protein
MRLLAFFMIFSLFASAPMAEAQGYNNGTEMSAKEKRKQAKQEAKQARKEAAQYYKEYIVKKRKALILVKKIEDERSRDGSIRSFKVLFEEASEEDDDKMGDGREIGGASGGSGVSDEAKNKAMEAERKKYEKQIKKIDAQIEAESTRIEEAELMTDELKGYITKSLE